MRSIGKRNIAKLRAYVKEELALARFPRWTSVDYSAVEERVIDRCPGEWWDLWEGAHTEIHNIIDDETMNFAHRR